MAAVTEKYVLGTGVTAIAGSALNGLVTNGLVLGAAINNIQAGGGFDGYTLMRVVCTFRFQVAPTANTGISVWFLKNTDGSTGSVFEDGGTALTPARPPDVVFPTSGDTSAHVIAKDVLAPAGFFKPLLKNDGTGQSLTANNVDNTLLITPLTSQGV